MVAALQHRELTPGSTGWTAADLERPEIARQWDEQRLELVHGVIAAMPAAFFDHSRSVDKLFDAMKAYFWARGIEPEFGTEVEFALDDTVVYRADGMMLLADQIDRQKIAQQARGESDDIIRKIRVVPELIVESLSLGHEVHDRLVKHDDYAHFGAPNYWIVNAYRKTLDCYRLEGGAYVLDVHGKSPDEVRPTAFPGLIIPLNKVFR